MFTEKEQKAIEAILNELPIQRGQEWLVNAHVENETGCGWGQLFQRPDVTTWGGTLDGIRGLLACGISQHDPLVSKSVEWMLSQQRPDGSFLSRDITWSCVEATAWVIITLREAGYNSNTSQLDKAYKFLEKCIQPSGGLGTSDKDEVRIYPTTLTLWALYGLSRKENIIADFLLRSIDKKSGGWGFFPKLPANPVLTAHVLYVLLITGHLKRSDEVCQKAIAYLFSQINHEGVWNNFTESWFSVYQTESSAGPNRCDHYSTTWILQALLKAGVDSFDPRIVRAFTWLVSMQQADGAWVLSESDITEYIWCTANCIISLNNVKDALMQPMINAALKSKILLSPATKSGFPFLLSLRKQMTHENFNTLLLVVLIVAFFYNTINQFVQGTFHYFQIQQDSILSNIVSSILWVILVALFTSLVAFFKGRQRDQ